MPPLSSSRRGAQAQAGPRRKPATTPAVAPSRPHARRAAKKKRAPARPLTAGTPARAAAATFSAELMRAQGLALLRGAAGLAGRATRLPESTARIVAAFLPLTRLLARETPVAQAELSAEIDRIFELLYAHPLTEQARRFTSYLRGRNVLPNEGTTENLIRYVVQQAVARSPIPVPQQIVDEFWAFFHELMAEPELRGLADMGLDIARLLLKTYEPLLAEVINELKAIFYANQDRMEALLQRVQVVRRDLQIIRRQIRALRYIRPFFQADPKDFHAQAQIVAKMVREFGPFFIKMAQVAAATADFLPEEIAKELAVFQEDVAPMSADEARAAIVESFGRPPEQLYFGFDADKPLKSGSIGSVYLARKPMRIAGAERLVPVVIKVGRHNLDREFLMGKTAIGLMVLSSQYWAPHGKLAPFLKAMTAQVDGFIDGFRAELQFEREAAVQMRFARRAEGSSVWRVPTVYASSERVIEMAYVPGAVNIARATTHFEPRHPQAYRRELARKLLFSLLSQVFVYQEVHGDLHPGNVMVDAQGRLHLIDWGNTVELAGKVAPVLAYLRGALAADADAVADALIAVSTDPAAAQRQRAAIRKALARTLAKKSIRPLTASGFAWTLYREGPEGWVVRAHVLAQLMSNTQQLGLTIRPEYLHLSRSATAAIATLAGLYEGVPRGLVAADLLWALNTFPARLAADALRHPRHGLQPTLAAVARRLRFAAPPQARAAA